jgi:hypothetical protein
MSTPARRTQHTPNIADVGLDFDATQQIDPALYEHVRASEATLSQLDFEDIEVEVELLRRSSGHGI